jgi:hypothetical protein
VLQELTQDDWGLRTQVNRATGHSTFFLVYGSEAILPTDIEHGAPRIQYYDEAEAEESRRTDLDSKEEAVIMAAMRHTRYEQQLRRYHDQNVRPRDFTVGTMVLRRIQGTVHKLQAPWDGPYIVKEVICPGTYRLEREDGTELPNVWNIQHLRKFYP